MVLTSDCTKSQAVSSSSHRLVGSSSSNSTTTTSSSSRKHSINSQSYHVLSLLYLYLLLLFSSIQYVSSQTYGMKPYISPAQCVGGEVCRIQPSVAVTFRENNELAYAFTGAAYVQLGKTPTGYEKLYIEETCGAAKCLVEVIGSYVTIPFFQGIAQFQKLALKQAGTYTLKFIGVDSSSRAFAMTYSTEFTVTVGGNYRLSLSHFVGTAFGGEAFSANPIVSILDKGDNIIKSINTGTVSVMLTNSPSGDEELRCTKGVSGLTVPFKNGYANFTGLYINEAGYPYELTFSTTVPSLTPIASRLFDVVVGKAAQLVFEAGTKPSASPKFAGEYFAIPPRLKLLDRGGNYVMNDNSTGVALSIEGNPTQSGIGPQENLFAVAKDGIVQFRQVRIDLKGYNYTLRFDLFTYSPLTYLFTNTTIYMVSERFHVGTGRPRQASIVQYADDAWAGQQAFYTQPILHLKDNGGNLLDSDFESVAQIRIVESLSAKKFVGIDTSDADATKIVEVTSNLGNASYGTGTILEIYLHARYHMWAKVRPDDDLYPYLLMNLYNKHGGKTQATLIEPYEQTRTLNFQYTVQEGDTLNVTNLIDEDSLFFNECPIVDGNNKTINATLPILFWESTLSYVNTSIPEIVNIYTNLTDGEYGIGEAVGIFVAFDQEVVVSGFPYIALKLDASSSDGIVYANFSHINPTNQKELVFVYLVKEGHTTAANYLTFATDNIDLDYWSNVMHTTIVNNPTGVISNQSFHYSYQTEVKRAWIRRAADIPTADVNYTIRHFFKVAFENRHEVQINTDRPILDVSYGVQAYPTLGTFYPGDIITLTVKFTKPVVINGVGIHLKLAVDDTPTTTPPVVPSGHAYVDSLLSDHKTLAFKYIVETYTTTSSLDIIEGFHAIILGGETGYIKRKSTFPTMDANVTTIDIYASNSLRDNSNIILNGYQPTVLDVDIVSVNPPNAKNLYPDDSMVFAVKFSSPVILTCPPVLVLNLQFYREAFYLSGNISDTVYFKYIVQMGDSTNKSVSYRNKPVSLCTATGCYRRSGCHIFANSSHPTLDADIKLPLGPKGIVKLGNFTLHPMSITRNTTIEKIEYGNPAGEYGVGTVLHFAVTFKDIIIVAPSIATSIPKLYLNIGRYASYVSGSYSKVLTFKYITTAADTQLSSPVAVSTMPSSLLAIQCVRANGCIMMNQAGKSINLKLANAAALPNSGILLDPTPPSVLSVTIQSPYQNVNYTSGQFIRMQATVSKPVVVGGILPKILLNFGKIEQYAVYSPDLSTTTNLIFMYQFRDGDAIASNYTYDVAEINMSNGYSVILRKSDIPTTPMTIALPPPVLLSTLPATLEVETLRVPAITAVISESAAGLYAAGDVVFLRVEFNMLVIARGISFVYLDVNHRIGKAMYVAFKDSSNHWVDVMNYDVASDPTKSLLFKYIVEEDDFSTDLEYVDTTSLVLAVMNTNDPSYIKRYDDTLGIDANLTLPFFGTTNTLSANGAIIVDGRPPYLTDIAIMNPAGVYSVNATIYITMTFSAKVSVLGGIPSLTLETGYVNQVVYLASGNNTKTLVFEYFPEPGDQTNALEYYTDRLRLLSAEDAFQYNGARIVAKSSNPHVPALIWLNPPSGYVKGTSLIESVGGVYEFKDSYITRRGLDYNVQYIIQPYNLNTKFYLQQSLYVSFSSEQQLRPARALKDERIGEAVSLQGDLAIVGAPFFNISVTTIQVVKVQHQDGPPQREVQTITTSAEPRPAVYMFHSTAGFDQNLGGSFLITFGPHGSTSAIPAAANAQTMSSILMHDIPIVGNVTVTVTRFINCACNGAFTWRLTFNDYYEGRIPSLSIDYTLLTGTDAIISTPILEQTPTFIDGSFKLIAFGRISNPVPVDATIGLIKSTLENDLLMPVNAVTVTSTTTRNTRIWSITFDAYEDFYDVPLLGVDSSDMFGGVNASAAAAVSRPGRHSPDGIAGSFRLSWRGNTTVPLPPRATSEEVKQALEDLPIINYVNVDRKLLSDIGAYAWTIELVDVNYHNARGYYHDETKNLEPIEPVNNLIASDVEILVESRWSMSDNTKIDSNARQGTFGLGAGAAFVYQRQNESWIEVATLRGNDTEEHNRFGTSVSLDDDTIIVGAIGASIVGVPERQEIVCKATDGYFKLAFRGWETIPMPHNVSYEEFIDAVVSNPGEFSKLYSITSLVVSDWGNKTFCSGESILLTFYSPLGGTSGLDANGADLELLTFVNLNLTYNGLASAYSFDITEYQKGTWVLNGPNADPRQIGAAYIYRFVEESCKEYNRTFCIKQHWRQEAQLFPTVVRANSQYGSTVFLSKGVAMVSALTGFDASGLVYIYEFDKSTGIWRTLQLLRDMTNTRRCLFGTALAKHGNTIAIGAPGYDNNRGGIYIYSRPPIGGVFIGVQTFTPLTVNLMQGSLFGNSISMYQNTIVVGASGYNDRTVHLGRLPAEDPRLRSGAVFVFTRLSENLNYRQRQILKPSNVKEGDSFGYKVSLEGNSLLVSSLESYDAAFYQPGKPIIEIKTKAAYNSIKLGGAFRIHWKSSNSTASNRPEGLRTRHIPYNISPEGLKAILEEDLKTDTLIVTRSKVDVYDGGYAWQVTFMRHRGAVGLFEFDVRDLKGTNATMDIQYLNSNPVEVRGLAHVFQRPSSTENFNEEVFLSPYIHQPQDRCGTAVSLSGTYALIGCPNRDQDIPVQNSGSAFIYDLQLLGMQYVDNAPARVVEGFDAVIGVERDLVNPMQTMRDNYFYMHTVDRNYNQSMQHFLADLYGVEQSALIAPQTYVDHIDIVDHATARSQFYGSRHKETSRWVDGRYDYRAIADYVPRHEAIILQSEDLSTNLHIPTNEDSIVEQPEELVFVAMSTPGLWPSVFGKLYHNFALKDNCTGFTEQKERSAKFAMDAEDMKPFDHHGKAVAVSEDLGVAFIAAPNAEVNGLADAGIVYQYKTRNNSWFLSTQFVSPITSTKGSNFGSAIAVDGSLKTNSSILAIGEVRRNRVHIYSSRSGQLYEKDYRFDRSLSIPEAYLEHHLFGDANTIAIDNGLLAIGAPGLELVVVYKYYYDLTADAWDWTGPQYLKSSDYDYDFINNAVQLHRQGFGTSVSISERTIAIGAPYADYDKVASYLVENYNTEGLDILSVGRGKVYVYTSTPAIQEVCVYGRQILQHGSFVLYYTQDGYNTSTDVLPFNSTAFAVEQALYSLPNMKTISVSREEDYADEFYGYKYCWKVTFYSEWVDPGVITASWNISAADLSRAHTALFDCENCTSFDYPAANDTQPVQVAAIREIGDIVQYQILTASDSQPGDQFGFSVAIDGNQIAVGAPSSYAFTRTSWDFEAGLLYGWTETGDAFDYQPTYGDNPRFRLASDPTTNNLEAYQTRSSGVIGRYYISTFEKHPGSRTDYMMADINYAPGTSQGTAPRGTLTSDVFMILGNEIKFYIGGGCDLYAVYVELLVDGKSIAKRTGDCQEHMKPTSFDTSTVRNRAGQIRIVDNSTVAPWGYINVDQFTFDWATDGASQSLENQAKTLSAKVETPFAGAAYVFLREDNTSNIHLPCTRTSSSCAWNFEKKLVASDKREGAKFGTAVAVNDKTGVVVVGAPYAENMGVFKDSLETYPSQYPNGSSYVAGLQFPLDSHNIQLFQTGSSGSYGVWQLMEREQQHPNLKYNAACGAIYVYNKDYHEAGHTGEIYQSQDRFIDELAKIQPQDCFNGGDRYGSVVSLDGLALMVGAPGQSLTENEGGAAYFYRTEFAAVKFSQSVYPVVEGEQYVVALTIDRDLNVYADRMVLEYATSDLTARGVDTEFYNYCQSIPVNHRAPIGCGDYEQTVGRVVLEHGVAGGGFEIRIMDDRCYERFSKFIQVTLSIPGTGALFGERLEAIVRIDDNDFGSDASCRL